MPPAILFRQQRQAFLQGWRPRYSPECRGARQPRGSQKLMRSGLDRAHARPPRTGLRSGFREMRDQVRPAALHGSLRHPFRADMIRRRVTMKTQISASGGVGLGRGRRMSRQRKRDTVLRMLRGEDLETLSRALGVTAATLTGWQDSFVAAG